MHAADVRLYDEAEEFIKKIDRIRDLQSSLWETQVEGMNVSVKDGKMVADLISEAIEDCFWERTRNAKRIIEEIDGKRS